MLLILLLLITMPLILMLLLIILPLILLLLLLLLLVIIIIIIIIIIILYKCLAHRLSRSGLCCIDVRPRESLRHYGLQLTPPNRNSAFIIKISYLEAPKTFLKDSRATRKCHSVHNTCTCSHRSDFSWKKVEGVSFITSHRSRMWGPT